MLTFYTLFSLVIFMWLGTSLIIQGDDKYQKTIGSLFIGAGALGICCLIIEIMMFRGIY